MFSLAHDSKLLGAGHVILNVLRVFNLIGLAAAMMASMAMPVLSGIRGHFFFFDMITHVFVFLLASFLFVSELPVPWRKLKEYFERNWPVLGPEHSLAWLGWGMVFIGFQILGDLWKPGYAVETIGPDWWRAILAAAILSATFGFMNITASVVFRLSPNATTDHVRVTARQIRTHGSLALQNAAKKDFDLPQSFRSHYSPPHRDNWSDHSWTKEQEAGVGGNGWVNGGMVGNALGNSAAAVRRMTRVFNPRNFRKSRITISKPIPQDMDIERGAAVHSSHSNGVSSADRASPILPEIQRPPTALHPAFTGGSRYSEAHMDRF
ncbi:hypothetical protein VTJ49DRAFT_5702 [Mycothermus thermophilus]|uniref:DUF7598 domain-containing protein n=1 Tax=Humicola insolens TaxID=85995 RepID=A0ABR3V2K2_HUMIN